MTVQEAEIALRLAAELQEAAKFVPIKPEDLLAIVEPSATSLDKLGPREALVRLTELDQLNSSDAVRRVVEDLVPSAQERGRIKASRSELMQFMQRLSGISKLGRKGRIDQIKAELRAVFSRWPESRFRTGLLGDRVESGFRRMLSDGAWLVPVMSDARHPPEIGVQMVVEGFRPEAVSPLSAWFACPSACADCWGRLRQRMRSAIEVWGEQQAAVVPPPMVPVTNEEAAAILRTSPSQVSRWLGGVRPHWVKEEDLPRLRVLLERIGGRLNRTRIEELLAWRNEVEGQRRGT